jgi:hypothetical protein
MSDDLVKRLRREAHSAPHHGVEAGRFVSAAHAVAADRYMEARQKEIALASLKDRIEKLEAALRAIIVHCEVPAPPNAEALKMFARKALEKKDE